MKDPRETIMEKYLNKRNNQTKCQTLARLFIYFFVNGKKIEAQNCKEFLLTKTTIFALIMTTKRFLFYFLGAEDWQKAYEEMDEVNHLNKELVVASQSYVTAAILITDLITLLLCITAFKFKKVARFVILPQLAGNIAYNFLPLSAGASVYPADKKLLYYGVYLISVCSPEVDIILCLISDLIIQFAIVP